MDIQPGTQRLTVIINRKPLGDPRHITRTDIPHAQLAGLTMDDFGCTAGNTSINRNH